MNYRDVVELNVIMIGSHIIEKERGHIHGKDRRNFKVNKLWIGAVYT